MTAVTLCVAVAGSLLPSGIVLAGQCSDPWVTQAVTRYLHRAPAGPGAPECNVSLYRGGHWRNQQELDAAVEAYWSTHPYPTQAQPAPAPPSRPSLALAPHASDFTVSSSALGYRPGTAPRIGQTVAYNGRQYQVTNILTNNGGTLVNTNGSNVNVVLKLIGDQGSGLRR